MFGIKRKVESLRADFDMIYHETLRIRNLFTKDRHGTVRPKVDMLDDRTNYNEQRIWTAINVLQLKIEKLEKKNENPKDKKT